MFVTPRRTLFDTYQVLAPRHRDPRLAPVLIVGVDDESLQQAGGWPWPRALQAKLISRVLAAHPAVVGVDEIWPEASSAGVIRGGPETILANAFSAGPVVIGVQGVRGEHCGGGIGDVGPFPPILTPNPAVSLARLPCFAGDRRSVPQIEQAAVGHGLLSNDPDGDGVFRRLQLLSLIRGQAVPDLALEIYRVAARAPYLTIYGDARGVSGVGVGPSTFPTERDAGLRLDYAKRNEFTVCSAATILSGRPCRDSKGGPPVSLDGRIVLIGVTAAGLSDQARMTPLGPMPGVEVNAEGVENLMAGKLARRPGWTALAEPALTLVVGLFLIVVLPRARGGARAVALAAPLLLLTALGALAWRFDRLLLDVATPTIGGGVVMAALLTGGYAEADAQRRRLREEVERGRLAAARTEGELEAARRIQIGILPRPESLAPDPRFDLDALMDPARQIGGDFYDFFKVDADRLFVAVGDVSGKGLPASLFMALSKSLCKSCALRGDSDIGAIVRRANAEISRDNPEMLFVTLFAAILNLETGEVSFCSAGHDAPLLLRPGEPVAKIVAEGGPPLCTVEDFPYATETRRLSAGELVCVTTDGVTEAMTADGALIGRDVVALTLAATPADAPARDVTAALRAAVAAFVADAEPSDDLTILALRWRGPSI
jgi:serine phosphatase RsbU (regulator of sigma subunit)/CHASE2 domain-containing sensor protein